MPYRYLAAFLLLLLPFSASRAQGLPGYVLTLSGDTLRGTLTELAQQQQVQLRGPDGQRQKFGPSQIRGYGLRGQALIASAVVRRADGRTAPSFVLPRLLGPASLFAYNDETGLLLLPPAPAADTLYELNAYNWHLLLSRHLPGCPALGLSEPAVLSLPFGERRVEQLLSSYNRCRLPGWQPDLKVRGNAYRRSTGVEAEFGFVHTTRLHPARPATGTSQRLLVTRSFLRASGLQATIGLGYTRLDYQTGFYSFSAPGAPVAEQMRERVQLLTGLARASQRVGQPTRPNLLLGLEVGFNYSLHSSAQVYQRPAAGGPAAPVYHLDGPEGLVPHLALTAGVALPFGDGHELQLNGGYLRLLEGELRSWHLRAAYNIFQK